MNALEITQMIISILSLFATIGVSVAIYWLEKRQSIQAAKEEEKRRLKELEHEADIFIMQNGEEIEFLPLCVFANNLNYSKKHERKIFNNFHICSDELKKMILEKQKVFIKELPQNWFAKCNERFIEDIAKNKLGRNLFYDNAKYTTRCITYFGKDQTLNLDKNIFQFQDYHIENESLIKRKICKCSCYSYCVEFLNLMENSKCFKNPYNISMIPPCDYIYSISADEDEQTYCYWNALLMRYLCCALRKTESPYKLVKGSYSEMIEAFPKTFEDIYYLALYELYLSYGKDLD